jgi:hypothetical protein
VSEFWSKRWNIAVSEMIRAVLFAPLSRRAAGPGLALFTAFALSGLAHTLFMAMALGRWLIALSFGAFFLVQPLLIAVERHMGVRRWRPTAKFVWTWTAFGVTSPIFVEPALQIVEQGGGGPVTLVFPTVVILGFLVIQGSVILVLASLNPAMPETIAGRNAIPGESSQQ